LRAGDYWRKKMSNSISSKVIELFSENGDPFSYIKLSARLPAFLKEFPPSDGYSVIVEANDALSIKTGLLKLYEAAIVSGKSFSEAGLPEYNSHETVVFTARLTDKDNKVISERKSVKSVVGYKDFEAGETAAVQRLLASLGHGGEIFDHDEETDFTDQNLTIAKPDSQDTSAEPVKTAKKETTKKAEAVVKKDTTENKTNDSVEVEGVSDLMIQQMSELSALKKIDIPDYTTQAGAKKALKFLQSA
jgi:hypothetical protein